MCVCVCQVLPGPSDNCMVICSDPDQDTSTCAPGAARLAAPELAAPAAAGAPTATARARGKQAREERVELLFHYLFGIWESF